jgi:predicted ester cyclase
MSKEINLATLGRIAEAVNTGNFDLFKEAVSIECIDHDPAVGQVAGPEGYRLFFTRLRNAFQDLSVALETLVADEESIAFAYTISGTQTGPLMGFAPTGEKIKIRGLQISKFKDGKMVERWGSSDELGISSSWEFSKSQKLPEGKRKQQFGGTFRSIPELYCYF